MPSPGPSSKKPLNWEDYDSGRQSRHGSEASLGSHVQFDEPSPSATSGRLNIPARNENGGNAPEQGDLHNLHRRRSSVSMRISSMTNAGGVNSLGSFARSWSRAAGFPEIPLRKPSYILAPEDEENVRRSGETPSSNDSRSLLRQHLEREGVVSGAVFDEDPTPHEEDEDTPETREAARSTPGGAKDVLERVPYLETSFGSSNGRGLYGSLSSRVSEPSMRHAGELYYEQQSRGLEKPDQESEPLLVKVVEHKDGKRVQVVIGQSTIYQTIFNSVNVLIGVGLLSLPLGLKYSGWLVGMAFFAFAAITTRYTAGILAKCLDLDTSMVGYGDIAYKALGTKGSVAISFIFTIELLATCVALVVLFADSLNALIPGVGTLPSKIFCGVVLIPLSFIPLRYLSFSSVLGIFACLGIVTLVFVDGIIKPHYPGSLREPAPMAGLFPQRWSTLPLSFGLLMSPWGGHSIFPQIYRDMRHPLKYTKAINYTYIFTYTIDVLIAIAGFAMFGQKVHDEISSNILLSKGYPRSISICIVVFIVIIPITKIPLNVAPINGTIEKFFGLLPHQVSPSRALLGMPSYARGIFKIAIRTLTIVAVILLAILVPSFDTIMALMGSAMAFSICIVLPLVFHLSLFGHELSRKETLLNWVLIVSCSIMGTVGTVWVFLPRNVRERMDGF